MSDTGQDQVEVPAQTGQQPAAEADAVIEVRSDQICSTVIDELLEAQLDRA